MTQAFIQWGEGRGPFMTESADDVTTTEPPQNPYRYGHGGRVPTQYLIRRGKHWHRVYCEKYGRVGKLYIESKGVPVRVTIIEGN